MLIVNRLEVLFRHFFRFGYKNSDAAALGPAIMQFNLSYNWLTGKIYCCVDLSTNYFLSVYY